MDAAQLVQVIATLIILQTPEGPPHFDAVARFREVIPKYRCVNWTIAAMVWNREHTDSRIYVNCRPHPGDENV